VLDFVTPDCVYPPELVVAAFDRVCRSVSPKINGDPDVRRHLALIILRCVDEGEHDPDRLSELALDELAGIDRSAVR